MSRIQSLRGFNDVLPEEAAQWRLFFETARQVTTQYGYREVHLPLMEPTELFKRAVGEATDIVEKEMFTFLDREKTSMSLRPEGTAGCVRAGIEHGLLHNQQQRLWYMGPMFRHERPQKARYRQFYQLGVEAFGMGTPESDVEVIALSARLLRMLGLASGVRLEINTLGAPDARAEYTGKVRQYFAENLAALDEDSKRRVYTNPLRIFDSKVPATGAIAANAPPFDEYLDQPSTEHFAAVRAGLDALGITYSVNPRLHRGLDYYTRTVFEWITDRLGAQGTVCAGGRYDGLVAQLGGGEVPAVGFAVGIERIVQLRQLLARPADLKDSSNPQAYLCWFGESAYLPALELAETLRTEGIRLIVNAGGGSFKSQLKRADKSGAEYALVLGDDELARRCVQLKSLRVDGTQEALPWNELAAALARRLGMNS